MNFIKEENRIYLKGDNNNIIAEINFSKVDNNTYDIFRMFVDPTFRGKGLASKLMKETVNYIKSKNCNVTASCSYAKKWLEKNMLNKM